MSTIHSRNRSLQEDVKTVPASFSQQRLWFLHQWNPEQSHYITALLLRIDGALLQQTFEESLDEIVQHHEILRTTFAVVDEQLTQVVAPRLTLPLSVLDRQHLPQEEWEAETQRVAQQEAQQPFDLTQGPLIRATLLQFGPEKHFLIVVAHQIIFDSWSTGVFLQELAALYQAHVVDQPAEVPTLPIQYTNFTLQQQEWLRLDTLAPHLTYWKQSLQQAPAALELPTRRAHGLNVTNRGEVYPFALSRELTDALKALSQQKEVSLSAPLLAAFAALLYRYTGQQDLSIGTYSAKRSWPETAALIGNFVNTLVLRADLTEDPSFQELVERIQSMMSTAFTHADVPFEYVMKELQLERNAGQNTLFQVLFALEPASPVLPSGWSVEPISVETGSARCDLSLILTEYPEGLQGYFEYRSDLFDTATIERMAGHWQTLLEAAVALPTEHLTTLPILTERERHQLLVEWNATQAAYPQDTPLHQLIEEQVECTPDAIAVSFGDRRLTYRELNQQANQLAHYLREKGVGPDVLVGIFVERSLEMVVGLLGILKAGGAYVPIDPTYPSERIAVMLEDAQVPALVTQDRLVSRLPEHTATIIRLDADANVLEQQPATNPVPLAKPHHLAYVIFTSGSTGRPKGVQIIHRAVVNFLVSMSKQPSLTAEDRLLAVTTLSFDIAGLEIYLPLIMGAQVIIVSTATASDGPALAQILTKERITVMQATPITWRLLLAAEWQGSKQLRIFCGGEALPPDLAQQLLPKVGALWNLYGPTETTIWSAAWEIRPEDSPISIGRPIANTEVYLLDPQLQPVPVGVPGELFIGGDGLARSYLHRPELTGERFIKHPFSNAASARIYRTGDLAYYQPDGTVVVIGRLDHQVKVRGFRIELGEIEAVLSEHPSVQQAVVVVREDTPGDKRLVAYVVAHAEQNPTIDELHQQIQKRLPVYMVPSAFMIMEAFPLTPNGKIDRRALPAPDTSRTEGESTFVAPKTFLQQQLATIWEDLLQVHPIGIRDNFFELGGHSLLAMRLINRIKQASGKELPLSTLFAGATIEQVAQALQQDTSGGTQETQDDTRTPLLPAQTGGSKRPFFFLHGQWEGGAFYSLELARALGPEQPFYLLEPYRFDGLAVPPSIEEMATAHLEVMRSVQPEGPYMFGGWCNGGLIAYEMAQQLNAQGESVDLLVLMDADAPAFRFKQERRLIDRCVSLLRLHPEKQVDWFLLYRHLRLSLYYWRQKQRVQKVQDHHQNHKHHKQTEVPASLLEAEAEALEREEEYPEALFPGKDVLRQDWLSVYEWAVAGYSPSPYPGKVTFFWTEEEPKRKYGWRPWMKSNEVDIHIIPGNHITSRTRYLSVLAEHLRTCVQNVQAHSQEKGVR
jgi:amino acid adenylation domain-containing protein